ncbi:MAG: hypothetical protein HN720_16180 [Nitrospinaceae bacterium]|nr:hypothetical protein [Nitrospinaceae bacterium]
MFKRSIALAAAGLFALMLLAPAAADAAKSKGKKSGEKQEKGDNRDKGKGLAQRVAALEALVSQAEALIATLATKAELAAHSASPAVHHARYSNTEAVAAVGPHTIDTNT